MELGDEPLSLTRSEAWAIARLDAHDQAALVRNGEASADTLAEAAILRIEEIDPALNAVSYRAFDHARAAAKAIDRATPMAGAPVLLKASLSYPGFPQTSGSRARRHAVGTVAYPFARRLDAAGLVAVGMSAMPEFGLLCSGEALLTGPTLNPWDASRTAGGSSTGAAVAVATGMVPYAHASDAAGSIRVPAANCGVVGFKPSRGWNVRARVHHLVDDLLCSDSLIARSVRDVAWALRMERPDELASVAVSRRPLRIALDLEGLSGPPDGEVADLVRKTAALCADLGHRVEAVAMPIDRAALREAIQTLWPYLGGDLVDLYSARHPGTPLSDLLEPWTIGLEEKRRSIPPEQLAQCYAAITDGTRAVAEFHRGWDVVLSPVTRSAPLPLGAMAPTQPFERLWTTLFDYVDYTPLHNLVGTPSVSLPLGMTADGLPIGSLLSAGQGADDLLLALAAELEQAAPWADRWPPAALPPAEVRRLQSV
ncbi:MAG: amidase family protein [Caulobacteraceae bacterium]